MSSRLNGISGTIDRLGAAAERDRDCDKARVTAHHLDAKHALVGERGVTNPVDCFQRGINCCIEADGVVGAGDVVVDRRRDDEDRDAGLVAEDRRAGHRALAADDDERLDLMTFQIAGRQSARGRGVELGRARSFQKGSTALNHIGDGAAAERLREIANQALVAAPEADHLDLVHRGAANHRTNRGVHARSVAAGSQYCDSAGARAG